MFPISWERLVFYLSKIGLLYGIFDYPGLESWTTTNPCPFTLNVPEKCAVNGQESCPVPCWQLFSPTKQVSSNDGNLDMWILGFILLMLIELVTIKLYLMALHVQYYVPPVSSAGPRNGLRKKRRSARIREKSSSEDEGKAPPSFEPATPVSKPRYNCKTAGQRKPQLMAEPPNLELELDPRKTTANDVTLKIQRLENAMKEKEKATHAQEEEINDLKIVAEADTNANLDEVAAPVPAPLPVADGQVKAGIPPPAADGKLEAGLHLAAKFEASQLVNFVPTLQWTFTKPKPSGPEEEEEEGDTEDATATEPEILKGQFQSEDLYRLYKQGWEYAPFIMDYRPPSPPQADK